MAALFGSAKQTLELGQRERRLDVPTLGAVGAGLGLIARIAAGHGRVPADAPAAVAACAGNLHEHLHVTCVHLPMLPRAGRGSLLAGLAAGLLALARELLVADRAFVGLEHGEGVVELGVVDEHGLSA
jgi:hypothetical protein